MLTVRRSHERGHTQQGWLDSRHTFSFAGYYDPAHTGVSVLRVINDDRVAPAAGFATHPHRDMEIVSYVLDGTIEHRDTLGDHTRIQAGEVQVMSAGSGIRHSEYNASTTEPLRFLQIWIRPNRTGSKPGYQQRDFSQREGLTLLVSPDGRDGSLTIHQDALIYKLSGVEQLQLPLSAARTYYLQLARGRLTLNGEPLEAGDGVTITDEATLSIDRAESAEALLFDLP